jgi:hypothetical protein
MTLIRKKIAKIAGIARIADIEKRSVCFALPSLLRLFIHLIRV